VCGICGLYRPSGGTVLLPVLREMAGTLSHRGPDDEGYYGAEYIGFGHRRLNIIDLETGHQPLRNEDGRLVIVFNGEIYNFPELRKRLLDRGHRFTTKTDTEVILHLYEEEGERCLDSLRGMFAFALWDGEKKELFFARDRLGKKPFYYFWDGGQFIFASELKAILKTDLSLHLDPDAVIDFFKYQFIPSPRTIYREVRKLPPGHFGKVGPNAFFIRRYWDIPLEEGRFEGRTEASIEEELEALLAEATKIRLISDVPLGAFLSGGLDSSLIAAFMKKSTNSEVKTFSIGFKEKSYDESPFAEKVSRSLQTVHKKYVVEYEIQEILTNLVRHFDEPFGDSSAIPTSYLSKCTRENVTVALSGDGGDELFGGYMRYIAHKLGKTYLRLPRLVRRAVIETAVRALPVSPGYYGRSFSKKMKLFTAASRRIEDGRHYLPQVFSDDEAKDLLGDGPGNLRRHAYDDLLWTEFKKADGFDDLTRLMWLDLHYYLPDDILVKVDRMSMLHSLEVRAPYLDQRLVEYVFNLPLDYKIRNFTSKYILKKIGRKYLPPEVAARKKQGFMAPLDAWFKSELRPLFGERVLANDLFNKRAVEKIDRDHLSGREDNSTKMWLLLAFAIFADARRLS